MRLKKPPPFVRIFVFIVFLSLAVCIINTFSPSKAQGDDENRNCFNCHSNREMQRTLLSGDSVSLFVDEEEFQSSIHGQAGLACTGCHTNIEGYPHPEFSATTYREFSLELYPICTECHTDQIRAIQGNSHMVALEGGNPEAAVCTDCHGNHYIQPSDDNRAAIPQTCRKCHSEIYDLYRASVHGAALIGDGNPDVPSCTDCHGVHQLKGPSTTSFHLFSPQICAKCHTDKALMDKYDLRSDTYDTYVSDFHGVSVILFQQTYPDQVTDKPVCIDCHGVHHILRTDDPESTVIKENLLETCKRCHPNATTNFPDSWLGHYWPSPEHAPIVFIVKMFYAILIPLIIGGMLIFVISDYYRMMVERWRNRRNAK